MGFVTNAYRSPQTFEALVLLHVHFTTIFQDEGFVVARSFFPADTILHTEHVHSASSVFIRPRPFPQIAGITLEIQRISHQPPRTRIRQSRSRGHPWTLLDPAKYFHPRHKPSPHVFVPSYISALHPSCRKYYFRDILGLGCVHTMPLCKVWLLRNDPWSIKWALLGMSSSNVNL